MTVAGDDGLAWGVPDDAPPPRRRVAWGAPSEHSAPVARGQHATEPDPTPVDAPNWSPIIATEDATPMPAAETPAGPPAAPFDPFRDPAALPEDTPAAAASAVAPEPAATSGTVLGDLFADGTTPSPLPVRVTDTPAAAPAGNGSDLSSMFDDDPTDLTPAPYVAPAAESAPVPVAEAQAPAVAAPERDMAPAYQSREEALDAWRAMQNRRIADRAPEQGGEHTSNATNEALTYRYVSSSRLAETVDSVLALGQTGDPRVQGVIGGFELTRDKALDAQQRDTYQKLMLPLMQANHVSIGNPSDVQTVFDLAYDELIGIGPLGPLWRDDDVTEIIVSGPDKVIAERNGRLLPTPAKFRDADHLRRTARDLAARVDDRSVSRSNPLVTAQLPGARVQFALAPVAPVAGVSITIRKFRPLFGLEDLLRFGALTDEMAAFLSDAVQARATVLVSGGTGSGKTTMINALSSFIPDTERVITIEDALELKLSNTHVESLLTKELASGDDHITIGQDELLRASLRMRPDRIIVGEIRDGKGCAVMLQAANTGHDGTMTTVHANNPDLALRRLTQLLRGSEAMSDDVAREEVSMAFDLIVQVVRVRGRRFVSHIATINHDLGDGRPATNTVFVGEYPLGADAPAFRRVGSLGSDTELAQRMYDAGLDPTIWR